MDHQPRPAVPAKKRRRARLIHLTEQQPDWALGFLDETWWSRLAHPALHAWADAAQPLRVVEQTVAKDDPDRKALAAYGLRVRRPQPDGRAEQVWLRFVDGRPVSGVTTPFLAWCCAKLAALRLRVWALSWDNASWHVSKAVRAWIRSHNQQVKQQGAGVRILSCYLPVKSPWLNPIEPQWVHGKRAAIEPARLLSAHEVADRACAYFGCPHEHHLIQERVS